MSVRFKLLPNLAENTSVSLLKESQLSVLATLTSTVSNTCQILCSGAALASPHLEIPHPDIVPEFLAAAACFAQGTGFMQARADKETAASVLKARNFVPVSAHGSCFPLLLASQGRRH